VLTRSGSMLPLRCMIAVKVRWHRTRNGKYDGNGMRLGSLVSGLYQNSEEE
jgi:hypothetical protein